MKLEGVGVVLVNYIPEPPTFLFPEVPPTLPEARFLSKGEWVNACQAVGRKIHNAQSAG